MNERDRIGNDDVLKAKLFAIKAHGDQKYGIHPYEFHLDAVVQILVPYGEMAQIAGYLHDIVEDTPITIEEISSNFGDEIADCIALVTDESGNN
ncbi:MAG: bifunctional (p)ppGpp synthetase/guanosine-3',5'-bis(diphosphate) 3'-pyrophosphohydrolase, partial [Planctomycetes bacterium]|nr:bifunctional (p)ppGpp synthetase/guanosine-3',5'-bis(diphosphate) 3'-pyrophosphohydrolase [Planctomycetota bacterium]